ncbi:tetratricopeptide repeat protein [Micromonospora sp. LOL_014]|uniref:tetratricopeptide repeat protein n=1 Tax=Micromonospora sp. LOL_014 TaxID=3345415 RepID=UPI003A892DB5
MPEFDRKLKLRLRQTVDKAGHKTLDDLVTAIERSSGNPIPRSTLADATSGRHPIQWPTLKTILIACGVRDRELDSWHVMIGRARTDLNERRIEESDARDELRAILVGSVWTANNGDLPKASFNDWKRLGVHEALAHALPSRNQAGTDLPTYIGRDRDDELRTAICAGIESGKSEFILTVGHSTAGKSRSLAEAMWENLSDWSLLLPVTPAGLIEVLSADIRLDKTVLWLDELQNYIATVEACHALASRMSRGNERVMILASMRAHHYEDIAESRNSSIGEKSLAAAAWGVIRMAKLITLERLFSEPEKARALSLKDPYLSEILARTEGQYGVAEYFAAGPELLRRWNHGRGSDNSVASLGAAIVDTAVDCYRAGFMNAPTGEMLATGIGDYLPKGVNPLRIGDELWEAGIAWASRKVYGASALLRQVETDQYQSFDYLIDAASTVTYPPIRPSVWSSLLEISTPDDVIPIGDRAAALLLPEIAEKAWRRGVNASDRVAARYAQAALLSLLVHWERINDAVDQALAQPSLSADAFACREISQHLALAAREPDLKILADAGDEYSSTELAELHISAGRIDEVEQLIYAGSLAAAGALANYRSRRGERGAAIATVSEIAENSDEDSRLWAARRLLFLSEEQQAEHILRNLVADGSSEAEITLIEHLAQKGDLQELQEYASEGNAHARRELARHFYNSKDISALERLAGQGLDRAQDLVVHLYGELGRNEDLARLDEQGDQIACLLISKNLLSSGRLKDAEGRLRNLSQQGVHEATERLADLFAYQGREAELHALAQSAGRHVTRILASYLRSSGRIEEALIWYRRLAEHGDLRAAALLVDLLRDEKRLNEASRWSARLKPFHHRLRHPAWY